MLSDRRRRRGLDQIVDSAPIARIRELRLKADRQLDTDVDMDQGYVEELDEGQGGSAEIRASAALVDEDEAFLAYILGEA